MKHNVVMVNAYYPHYRIEQSILEPLGAQLTHIDTVGKALSDFPEIINADAILTRETKITATLIDQLKQCKVILRYGVGIDNIDLEAAKNRNIYVVNVPDYGSDAVAEHALALMLCATRRITTLHERIHQGQWGGEKPGIIYSFKGKTLGLIGTGRIGMAFVEKCQGLGFKRVIAYDPYISTCPGVELHDFDSVIKESDFLSLHTPLTPQTKHMINRETLKKMKPTLVLVNTARGGLINEHDLAEALKNGTILAAGLDVFENEPLPTNHPLMSLQNVVLTNHVGWYNEESIENLQRKAAEEVARVLKGEVPIHWVNRP